MPDPVVPPQEKPKGAAQPPSGVADNSPAPVAHAGRSRRTALVALVGIALVAGAGALVPRLVGHAHDGITKGQLYQCPMHPTITSDHPSDCPICGMRLVPVASATSPSAEASALAPSASGGQRAIAFYRSPMNPAQTSPVPRKDEMGMDYLPVYEDEARAGEGKVQVPGLAPVTIDPSRQQLIGLRTTPVTRGPVGRSWRTVGRLQADPTRVRKTNVKVEGYVEHVYVDFVSKPVAKGQPLFSFFSPSLLAAQEEYLVVLRTSAAFGKGDGGTNPADLLLQAARRKLELLDVGDAEIKRLERTGQPSRTITVVSPIAGVVTAKNIVEGSRLNAGDTPYEITDLSRVWLMADAYESDLKQVRVGMSATLKLDAYPDEMFTGHVEFIEPALDPRTRTVGLHVHFPNPKGLLKPEMYGTVELKDLVRSGLSIPADAVVRSGTRDVVFVSLGSGKFQPREVKLGVKDGETVELVAGLVEGEQVVTRANFLIDSESRLRASLAALGSP